MGENTNISKTQMFLDHPVNMNDLEDVLKEIRVETTLASYILMHQGKRDKSNEEMAFDARISVALAYKIMKGVRRPEQDVLLRIAFALKMTAREAQYLLKIGRRAQLTASRKRDVAIIMGLQNDISLEEMDKILIDNDLEPLIPQELKLSVELEPLMEKASGITYEDLIRVVHPDQNNCDIIEKRMKKYSARDLLDWMAEDLKKDDLIRMGFILQASKADVQHLLKTCHRSFLSEKSERDQAIMSGLSEKKSLQEMNAVLAEKKLALL